MFDDRREKCDCGAVMWPSRLSDGVGGFGRTIYFCEVCNLARNVEEYKK